MVADRGEDADPQPPWRPVPGLIVRIARDEADMAAVREIRRRVFGFEQGVAGAGDVDQDDPRSMHALAIIPEGAIGTGRLTLPTVDQPHALVAWVSTLPAFRRRGVAAAIMRALLDASDAAGVPTVLLSAQVHALEFYGRLGFRPYGDRFVAGGIEHQFMYRHRR